MPAKPKIDERNDPKYLNYLFLRAFLGICVRTDTPEDVRATIQAVLDTRAYDILPRLRREANAAGEDFAARLFEVIEEEVREELEQEYEDEDDWRNEWPRKSGGWVKGLVSAEKASANKKAWNAALVANRRLKIRYVSDTSGENTRIVRPMDLEGPYGEAFCELRHANRIFRFDRMLEVEEMKD